MGSAAPDAYALAGFTDAIPPNLVYYACAVFAQCTQNLYARQSQFRGFLAHWRWHSACSLLAREIGDGEWAASAGHAPIPRRGSRQISVGDTCGSDSLQPG